MARLNFQTSILVTIVSFIALFFFKVDFITWLAAMSFGMLIMPFDAMIDRAKNY